MSMELIYTSAPKGLKPGTRGFCTVAMTQGMPPQLVERLESLSGYRQVFAPQDPQTALNPVVQSHLRISVAGRNFHVLSRICAAGLDYSQRNNKFAHHLVLDPRELSPAGPAWTLAQPGVMEIAWDGTPRMLAAGRRLPSGNVAPDVCHAWRQLTGDAGWGGVLAEAAIERPKSPVTIIFRPGIDPLPLIAESLGLLPPERRWTVTFSTYFTKLPPGVECQWRCALEGSAEAKGAPGLVMDLCRPLGPAQGGRYVAAARTGKLPVVLPYVPQVSSIPAEDQLERLLSAPNSAASDDVPVDTDATVPVPIEAIIPPLAPDIPRTRRTAVPLRSPKQPPWSAIITAAAAAVVVIAAGITAAVLASREQGGERATKIDTSSPQERVAHHANSDGRKSAPSANSVGDGSVLGQNGGAHEIRAVAIERQFRILVREFARALPEKEPLIDHEPLLSILVLVASNKDAVMAHLAPKTKVFLRGYDEFTTALAEARQGQERIERKLVTAPTFRQLPAQRSALSLAPDQWSIPLELDSDMTCALSLFGGDSLPGGARMLLDRGSDGWKVQIKRENTLFGNGAIATFRQVQKKLVFEWASQLPVESDQLANCVLEIDVLLPAERARSTKFISLRSPSFDRESVDCSSVIEVPKPRLSEIKSAPILNSTSLTNELFLFGESAKAHSIARLKDSLAKMTYNVDQKYYFSMSSDLSEPPRGAPRGPRSLTVDINYEGIQIPPTWIKVVQGDEGPLAGASAYPTPTRMTPAKLKDLYVFFDHKWKDAIVERDAIPKNMRTDSATKERLRSLNESIPQLEKARDEANAADNALEDFVKSHVQLGYRISFPVPVRDRESTDVVLAQTSADAMRESPDPSSHVGSTVGK